MSRAVKAHLIAMWAVLALGGLLAFAPTATAQRFGLTSLVNQVTGTLPFGNGGTGLASAADDTTLVSSGSAWAAKTLPSCANATTSKLLYDQSTNSYSCGTDQTGSGGSTVSQGAFGSLPGTCTTGDVYLPTDSVYSAIRCSATNTWSYFLSGRLATPPAPASGWTGANTGANWTATDGAGTIDLSIAYNATGNWRMLTKAQPSTPYTVSFYLKSQQVLTNSQASGVYFYDGTKWMGIEFLSQGAAVSTIRVQKLTNATSASTTPASYATFTGPVPYNGGVYARLGNTGTTLSFLWSLDGVTYHELYNEAVGTFITPTHYGIGGTNQASGFPLTLSVQSVVVQ